MQLRQSMRRAARMRLALAGASGSGKTYSSLLIAYGMTGDWSRVAVIDSENCSADLYAHLGGYQVLTLENYAPETYIEAIGICEQAGAEVIIIDSISHCWDYLLDFHANLQGNSFANWAKVTPRQNAFIRSCYLHHAFQAGLRPLGQERQDGSREGGLESRTARQRGLRVYRCPRHRHEPQGRHVQRPHGTVHGASRVPHHTSRGTGHPQMVQHDTACTTECPTSNSLLPCTQRFSLMRHLPWD